MESARHRICSGPDADLRLTRAALWIAERQAPRVTLLGASHEGASEVARRALSKVAQQASFGWHRSTLDVLAIELTRAALAARGLVPASRLMLEAVAARVVHEGAGALGRFAPIASRPGFPRALARTLDELRLHGAPASTTLAPLHERLDGTDLGPLLRAYEAALAEAHLIDRAGLFHLAAHAIDGSSAALGDVVLVDVPIGSPAERTLVLAIAKASTGTFATLPGGDDRTRLALASALGAAGGVDLEEARIPASPSDSSLARLKAGLFGDVAEGEGQRGDDVAILSAPGESREAVEIARVILRESARGTPFDAMAVLLRDEAYAAHIEEAFGRAKIPAYFASSPGRPCPSGRALLALVACAAEGFSAQRFAEYLSLGELPRQGNPGASPNPDAGDDRTRADEFGERLSPEGVDDEQRRALVAVRADAGPDELAAEGRQEDRGFPVPTPRRWEELLSQASVIEGRERWKTRLDLLHDELAADRDAYAAKGEASLADSADRDRAAVDALRTFAEPILDALAELPGGPGTSSDVAPWSTWLAGLRRISERALRNPSRVLALLAELEPMGPRGPVSIGEVRLLLARHLLRLPRSESSRRHGRVYIAPISESRGLAFDVVFIPGFAEKLFPRKLTQDPLLLDGARRALSLALPTNDDRSADERLLLRLAVGAARRRLVLSYPRVDVERARPRMPSFYGLEVLRVTEGRLQGFEHLADVAAKSVEARIGWPAPALPQEAIDDAEHDLSLLDAMLQKPEGSNVGEAHYLLQANAHLARALRFRGRRWLRPWRSCDGLVDPSEEGLRAIREHALDQRSFSPTALQNFAACPYKFYLSAICKLAPREVPEATWELDPLTRGSLVHETQFHLLTKLRDEGLLPVTAPRLDRTFEVLDEALAKTSSELRDRIKPAIERVYADTLAGIAADLREWLRRTSADTAWTPAYFELSFGLKDRREQDTTSTDAPVTLPGGLKLRGSIDLIERDDRGRLRATDHKTGKIRAKEGETVIGGGETLQPVLYALVIEKLFPREESTGGRLYYCTAAGDFTPVDIPLTSEARRAAELVAKVTGEALSSGFLPAAPAKDACKYCDYRPVCGPYEELRAKRKQRERLLPLAELRSHK